MSTKFQLFAASVVSLALGSVPAMAQNADDYGVPTGADSMTYEGGLMEKAQGVGSNVPIHIAHTGGTVSVRCQDIDAINAQISYTLEGTDPGALQTMGNGIGLAVTGNEFAGRVQSRVPYKPGSITQSSVPLVVSIPRKAQLTVTAQGGWIEVLNCEGTVVASTNEGGAYAKGTFSRFDLVSATGDVTVILSEDSKITTSSRAVASTGDVKVTLPMNLDARMAAQGAEVNVLHTVTGGQVTASSVTGDMGAGGPSIALQAKGAVDVTGP